ncbi:MAG: TolC family protein [Alphaproteobacteria bacterium]
MNKFLYSIYAISLAVGGTLPSLAQAETPMVQTAESISAVSVSSIDLDVAIQKALNASPLLQAAAAQLDGIKGAAQQAGALINPEISLQAENFAGTGNFDGINHAEITYGVSQKIELGGERSFRKRAAKHSVIQGHYDMSIAQQNLIRDVRIAYHNAVSAREMLALAKERKAMAQEMINAVRKRVNSASEPEIQLRKAEIALSTADVLEGRLVREYEHTKHVLTSLWAGHNEPISLDGKDFFKLSKPLSEDAVEAMLSETAAIKRLDAEKSRKEALYDLEKAEALPDPTVSIGLRDLRATDDQAFVASVTLPIPVLNSNQGNITFARSMMQKAESDQKSTHIALRNETYEWLESQTNAYYQVQTLKSSIIPAAEEAFNLAREGYRAGRFAYLEVLDAQRTLFEVKEQYIEALNEYHIAFANVERLTTPVGESNNE